MIGIIAANNVRFSPYIFYYTDLLDEIGIEYEVVIPDRHPDLKENFNGKLIKLSWDNKKKKIFNYIIYSNAVKKIAKRKYNYLIVLTTVNGVFSFPWLKKFFSKRYILDIRDYTHEYNKVYFEIEKRLIYHAEKTVISSKKYQEFLPKHDYLICNNINNSVKKSKYKFKKKQGKIIIGYVGAISYETQCKKMIDLIDKDENYEFHFYGTGIAEKKLREYVQKQNKKRIIFYGKYDNVDKERIIQKIDILFNVYGNGTPLVDYALSNKLYDALLFHKPILTSPNTYMHELGGPLSFAMDLDKNDILLDLWTWYQKLDNVTLDQYANELFPQLVKENLETQEAIKQILKVK